tara:strand:- start:568 stop:879 length:312 start_codon:yes stop_codon:yes gene_type:complete
MDEQIILALVIGIIIPIIFNKLTKSDNDNYGMIFIVAIVGGITSFIQGTGFWTLFPAPIFAVFLSLVSFFKKSWTIDKTFYKSLVGVLIFLVLGMIALFFNNQ